MKTSNKRGIPDSLLALCVAAFASGALAGDAPPANASTCQPAVLEADSPDASGALPHGASLRAYIDPVTGRLRQPTAAELQTAAERATLGDGLNGSIAGLRVEVQPNGTKLVNVQGRFRHSLLVVRDPDGKLVADCIDGSKPPTQSVAPTVTTPAASEE